MTSFTQGSPEDLYKLSDLFQAEFDEVGHEGLKLSLNIPLYHSLMLAGRGFIFLAKDGESTVGYSSWTIAPHPKYSESGTWAFSAGIYLLPEYRRARTAMRLIQYSEARLKELGVSYILAGGRVDHSAAARLYEALEFKPHEVSYIKKL